MSRALSDVITERASHPDKGYTERHDDEHVKSELIFAGMSYAALAAGDESLSLKLWPWDEEDYKPRSERENLVRAAALIIAEIERIDRAG